MDAKNMNDIGTKKQEYEQLVKVLFHDIKNPLSSLIGYLGLIKRCIPEEKKQYVTNCLWSAKELSRLCENIEDTIELENNKIQLSLGKYKLKEIFEKILKRLEPESNYFKKEIVLEIPENIDFVNVDLNLIEKVMYSIIYHCLQNIRAGQKVEVVVKQDSNYTTVEIKDEGQPLSEEDLPDYFDKFFVVNAIKGKRRGRGLNFYFCKLIIELHKGKLILNRVDNKNIFSVSLLTFNTL